MKREESRDTGMVVAIRANFCTLLSLLTDILQQYHRRPRHLAAALLKTDVRPADKRWRSCPTDLRGKT